VTGTDEQQILLLNAEPLEVRIIASEPRGNYE
jgi:hypothetical protein